MSLTTPSAVLFDCDGVLVDSEPITDSVLIANLAGYGLHLAPEQVTKMFTGGTIKGVEQSARSMGADLPADWIDRIYAATFEHLQAGTPLIDGVPEVLDALDLRGIPYAIGSNGPMAKMRITLGQHGLWDRFQGRIFSCHEHGDAKPAPDLYLRGAAATGQRPEDCVVIDDSVAGCRAGVAAGSRTIGFAHASDPESLRAVGADPVTSMAEVRALLGL